MAVTLIGADGLFTRLGVLEDLRKKIVTQQNLLVTEADDILDEYNNARDLSVGIQEALDGHVASTGSMLSTIRSIASRTLIEMVDADTKLTAKTERAAIEELIRQMVDSSDDVDGTVVDSSVAAIAGVGNGFVILNQTNIDGDALEYIFAEKIIVLCTRDAQVKGVVSEERFSVTGETPVGLDDRLWPAGSGISRSLTASSPSIDASATAGKNLLKNSDMESFGTTDVLDSWTYDVGSAGTHFFEEGTIKYRGNKAINFTESGGTLNKMHQRFTHGGAAGNAGQLKPDTKYAMIFRIRAESGVVAGVLRVGARDGGDAEVGSSAHLVTLSGVSTGSWDLETKAWNSPTDLPATVDMVVEFTTAPTSGKKIYIDDLMLVPMIQLGAPFGPYIVIIPGSTAFVIGDKFTITMTNQNQGEFQRAFRRWFDMGDNLLPSVTDGSETIADTLIA